nr:MAG TPA: protein of unknown function (DUF4373) [Caudoviricetes sp.]
MGRKKATKPLSSYFPHDSNARNDERLVNVRMKHGPAGYGVYFMLVERLREDPEYMSVVDYNLIAYDLRIDASLAKSIIRDFGLFAFTVDTERGECFYSESLRQRMARKDEITAKRKAASAIGVSVRQENLEKTKTAEKSNQMVAETQPNGTPNGSEKRTKGKESKVKENSTSSPYVEEAHAAKPLRNAGARDEAASVAPSAGGDSKDKSDFDLAAFARYFNETMAANGAQIPQVRSIPSNSKRAAFVRARLKEHGKEALAKVVQNAAKLSFYNGGGARGWVADFDWLFRPANFLRVLEDTRANAVPKSTNITTTSHHGTTAKSVDDNRERQRQRGEYFDDMLERLTYGNG